MKYYRNIYYDTYKSKIYLWDYKGRMIQEPWVPYLFMKTDKDTGLHDIYGNSVNKIPFDSYKEYKLFQKNNYDVQENNVIPSIQYLTKKYSDNDNTELPNLHICFLDIECPHDDGFPNVKDVPAEIVLISIIDETGKITVFGKNDYNSDKYPNVEYIYCKNEHDLLNSFFNWFNKERFDVISGWNINRNNKTNMYGGFDTPYIIRRSIKIFGENGSNHKLLSPINKITIRESNIKNGVYDVDIAGLSIIDYLALYKWFSFNNLESFTLGYVSSIELNDTKNDYSEYDSMYDFYKQDWNGFVDYCIKDSDLVYRLEKKLGYIDLAQMLTCYCGCQMMSYNSSVPLIEGLMLKYYRNNDLCAPKMEGGKQIWFPAAYVKNPKVGLYKDVVDLDIASSYPTHIIILNMSIETYYGRIIGYNKKDVNDYYKNNGIHEPLHKGRPIYDINIKHTRQRKYPSFALLNKDDKVIWYNDKKLDLFNKALERGLFCIAPNGVIFTTNKKGTISYVEQRTFEERVKQKGLKTKYKNKAKEDHENAKHWKELAQNKHVLQWAIKILINSMFGVLGVPYCRYFNPHIAEAITSCGRHTILNCEKFVNDLVNSPDEGLINIFKEIEEEIEKCQKEKQLNNLL